MIYSHILVRPVLIKKTDNPDRKKIMTDDLVEEQINPALECKLPRYNYGIVLECDFPNEKKKQVSYLFEAGKVDFKN